MFKYGGESSYKSGIRGLGMIAVAHQQPVSKVYGMGEMPIPVYATTRPSGVRYTVPHYKYPGMGNALYPFDSKFNVAKGSPRTLSGLGFLNVLDGDYIGGADGGAPAGTQNDPDFNFADPTPFWDGVATVFSDGRVHDMSSFVQFHPAFIGIGLIITVMALTGKKRR